MKLPNFDLKFDMAADRTCYIFAGLIVVIVAAPVAAASRDTIYGIVDGSSCAKTEWKQRGVATPGYMRGMATMFARSACRIADEDVRIAASKPTSGAGSTDALAWYAPEFAAAGMFNTADGVVTLRHVYTLLIGLGMRESSGHYCIGRDQSADFSTASSAEAGLFQTSWGASAGHSALKQLFKSYQAGDRQCELDAFARDVSCSAWDKRDWGKGVGHNWQHLTKACPAFATEYAAVVLRIDAGSKGEFGPIRRKETEVSRECDAMLATVQTLLAQRDFCADLEAPSVRR